MAPLESEPIEDPEGRAAPFAEPETPAPTGPEDTPARPLEPAPPAEPAPGFSIEPPPTTPTSPPPLAAPPQHLAAEPASRVQVSATDLDGRSSPAQLARPAGSKSRADPIPVDDATAIAEAAPATQGSGTTRHSKPSDGRIHIVRPGESLWTIAEDLLGSDASATNIAAEVARLWEVNRERIPSGDPDLIAVGQQLKLR